MFKARRLYIGKYYIGIRYGAYVYPFGAYKYNVKRMKFLGLCIVIGKVTTVSTGSGRYYRYSVWDRRE